MLGRLKMQQYLLLGILFVPCYMFNEWLVLNGGLGLVKAGGVVDTGGSIVIHAFGAIFGLGVALTMTTKQEFEKTIESDAVSDRYSMLGSMILWVFWPSFCAALVTPEQMPSTVVNVILALCGSTITTYIVSVALRKKVSIADIANAALAGGVAIGSACANASHSESVIIGILATAVAGIPFGLTQFQGVFAAPPSIAPTFLQMDIGGALQLGLLSVVFTFFLVDLLDNAGTLIATTHRAGLMRPDGSVPRLGRALMADSGGAMIGAALGTSTTVSFIESAAGIQQGGRTGLTALTVAGFFLLALFLAPLAASVPAFATAPALVFVACLMAQALKGVDWGDETEYLPAMLTVLAMPFTFSIATGIGLGFLAYAGIKTLAGRAGEVHGAVWVLSALCALKFAVG